MESELISICLTTYNRASTLHLTIESILAQTYSNFELIISDDNSSDGTRDVCELYVSKDRRVRYYRNDSNLKMPGNLNAAISLTTGRFVANLHDGDIYRTDLIEKWVTLLNRYPAALFVFNQYNELDKNNRPLRVHNHELENVNDGRVLIEYYLKTLTSAPWGTVMARKEAYEEHGMFDGKYGFISDVEMWLRLGLHGKVCYVNEPLIDLTPREKSHPYFLPHWRIFCLRNLILIRYYKLYIQKYPDLSKQYPLTLVLKKVEYTALRSIATLVKHKSVSRIKEGIYVAKQLPFPIFKKIGKLLSFFGSKSVPYETEVQDLSLSLASVKEYD